LLNIFIIILLLFCLLLVVTMMMIGGFIPFPFAESRLLWIPFAHA
jgi:hypothetical protein